MKKIFTNDKFFLAMVLCAVLGELIFLGFQVFVHPEYVISYLSLLIRIGCVAVLYSSYRKHSKNVMKGMMGALLMAQLLTSLSYLSSGDAVGRALVYVVLNAALFVVHFIINSDHHSSPALIRVNQVLFLLMAILNTVTEVVDISRIGSFTAAIPLIADIFGFIGMMAAVVCVESRLDAYRIEREAKGYVAK